MGGLALLFGGAIAAMLAAGFALSRLLADPKCTEGPCTQDVVMGVSVVLAVFIGVLWLVAAIAYDAHERRESQRDGDR